MRPISIVAVAFACTLLVAASPYETEITTTQHSGPAKTTRMTKEAELRAPFGKVLLIVDVDPDQGSVGAISVRFNNATYSINNEKLRAHNTYAEAVWVRNGVERFHGKMVSTVMLIVPYVPLGAPVDSCPRSYMSIHVFPNGSSIVSEHAHR
jgi:hypothetical protein